MPRVEIHSTDPRKVEITVDGQRVTGCTRFVVEQHGGEPRPRIVLYLQPEHASLTVADADVEYRAEPIPAETPA